MNPNDDRPLSQSTSVCPDAHDSSTPTTMETSTLSTITYEMDLGQEIPVSSGATICLSSDADESQTQRATAKV